MGIYLNPGTIEFQESINSEVYVYQPAKKIWKVDGGRYACGVLRKGL